MQSEPQNLIKANMSWISVTLYMDTGTLIFPDMKRKQFSFCHICVYTEVTKLSEMAIQNNSSVF